MFCDFICLGVAQLRFRLSASGGRFRSTLRLVARAHRSIFLAKGTKANGSAFLGCVYTRAGGGCIMLTPAKVTTVGTRKIALRSFFGLPFHPVLPSSPSLDLGGKQVFRFFGCEGRRQGLVSRIRLVVVSRVSVMQTSVVSYISQVLHIFSNGVHLPFKNGRLLFINSIFRLRPIIPTSRGRVLDLFCTDPFFFSTHIFGSVGLIPVRLRGICQRASPMFVGVLSHVHDGVTQGRRLSALGTHCFPSFVPQGRSVCVALTAQQSRISFVGRQGLKRLPNRRFISRNGVRNSFPRSSLPARLGLSVGRRTRIVFVSGSCRHH